MPIINMHVGALLSKPNNISICHITSLSVMSDKIGKSSMLEECPLIRDSCAGPV